jgi:hypothetical protein
MADLEQQLLGQDSEILGLQRQRQLADLLTGQAFNQPQGQMISGRYVAPSALQQALPMIQAAIGGITNANLDTKQTELAAALRQQKGEAYTKFQDLMSKPETRSQAMQFAAKNQFLQPLVADMMKPQYDDLSKRYLSDEARDIVNKTPELLFNFTYCVWNGSGYFQKFSNVLFI